jgi:hypothetical protein
VTLVLVLATTVLAGPSAEPTEAPTLLPARYSDGRFFFPSKRTIDWQRLAPKRLTSVDITRPNAAQRRQIEKRRDAYNNAEFGFDAPIPDEMGSASFFLISPAGIASLKLLRMHGTVRFTLSKKEGEISERSFFGELVAAMTGPTAPSEGGFVVESALSPVTVLDSPAEATVRRLVSAKLDAEKDVVQREALQKMLVVKKAFEVRLAPPDGPVFVFIQWAPDTTCAEACCTDSYELATVEQVPRTIASNRYGCDI